MNFELTKLPLDSIDAELQVIIVIDNDLTHRFIQDKDLLLKAGFKGGQNETCMLLESNRLYVAATNLHSTNIRPAIASAIKTLATTTYSSLKIATYLDKTENIYTFRAMIEGIKLQK